MPTPPEQLLQWNFRWTEETDEMRSDDLMITITPSDYLLSLEAITQPGPDRKLLRLYRVRLPDGVELDFKNEKEVERLLGQDPHTAQN